MARNRGFNGSVLSFGGTPLGFLRSISINEMPYTEVDVTDISDITARFESWLTEWEVTAETVGTPTTIPSPRGSKGALVVVWNDGNTETLSGAQFSIASRQSSGRRNGELVTRWRFRPTTTPPAPPP